MAYRVLVCGDRRWRDKLMIAQVLDRLLVEHPDLEIIEGEAEGADIMSREWAEGNGVTVHPFPALWDATPETPPERLRRRRDGTWYDVAAGPIRNGQMLRDGRPDEVHAFHLDLSRSRGTVDMVRRATRAGVPVSVWPRDFQPQQECLYG